MTIFADAHALGYRRRSRRSQLGLWAFIVSGLLAIVIILTPAQYVVAGPGGVYDALGTIKGQDGTDAPVLSIPGETVYPTDGELGVLTVSIQGDPDHLRSWADVLRAWIDPVTTPVPIEVYYPAGTTGDDLDAQNAESMRASQEEAIAAALTSLGRDYQVEVEVATIAAGSPADGLLEVGDRITAVDGAAVTSSSFLIERIQAAGVDGEVSLSVLRSGRTRTVAVVPRLDERGLPAIGAAIQSSYRFPIQVAVQLGSVGGPSAGLIFSLAIIDKLTPASLTGGHRIAGTGTISATGRVGGIGGIGHKLHGAAAVGADWVLIPSENCAEVAGDVPDGLRVVPVATLDEALRATRAIATGIGTELLPRCR